MLTRELVDFFPEARRLALDIESTGLDIWEDHVTAIALSDGEEAVVVEARAYRDQRALIRDWLDRCVYHDAAGRPRDIVVHNSIFDLPFLVEYYGAPYPERVWDTKIAEKILVAGIPDPAHPKRKMPCDLAATVQRRLGVTLPKDEEIRLGFGLEGAWSAAMIRYAADDAGYLIPLADEQRRLIQRAGMTRTARIEMAVCPVFAEMYRRGVAIDVAGMQPLLEEAEAQAQAEAEKLQVVLTTHIFQERKRANAKEEAKLAAWNARFAAAEAAYAAEWDTQHADPEWQMECYLRWVGEPLDGGKVITQEEVESWFAADPDANGVPKGRKRFVKRMMYLWRRQPGNERPTVKVVEVTAPINVNSVPQKRAAIESYLRAFNREHGTTYRMPKSLERGVLEPMTLDAHPKLRAELLDPLIAYSIHDKRRQMLKTAIEQARGPEQNQLHCRWNQIGTDTGRPSGHKPNLLNQPNQHRFRKNFVARPGHLFIICDQSQVEQRILAQLSGDPVLTRVFVEGRDIHRETASQVYGVPYDAVTDDLRKKAKRLVFGMAYGLTAMGYRRNLAADKVIISQDEAEQTMAAQKARFAVSARWIETQGEHAVRRGWTQTALGRKRYFPDVRQLPPWKQDAVRREGANHCIQGTNADITKIAMALIAEEVRPLGGAIVLQVYDEIVVEVPEAHAVKAKDLVYEAMTAAMQMVLTDVPAKADIVISPTWSEDDGHAWEAAQLREEAVTSTP